jgi:hypothetical protein
MRGRVHRDWGRSGDASRLRVYHAGPDVVYSRSRENIRRLATALAGHGPYLRGAPPGLPFVWDERTIRNGLNFTLTTEFGDLDLLGEVAGGGTYEDLLPHSNEVAGFGVRFRLVDLETLIVLKRAAGRPKDLPMIAELQGILERTRKMES